MTPALSTSSSFSTWSTLWPAFVLMTYFVVAFVAFSLRTWLRGMAIDAEVLGRPDSPVLSRFLRHYIMWLLAPWQRLLVRSGVTPNALTFASLCAAAGSGVAAACGRFALAGWLYFLCGILDILDGRVARIRNQVSQAGAFFDSVIDRYAELFVFGGMTVYYRSSWALGVVLLASLGSLMVSYTRARGEALGVSDLNIGLMQRPERLFYLGLSMIWAPIVEKGLGHGPLPPFALVVGGLLLLAISTNLTAVRRIAHTMARLNALPPNEPAPVRAERDRKERPERERSVPAGVHATPHGAIVPLRAARGRSA
jgi:CDP-diacylglycerol---glycerol-3-phosphate 3-phosphatidyltransferase